MNTIVNKIEKHQEFFEKISRNIYLQAIKDGFLAAMPIILFSSIFLLLASLPTVVGITLPTDLANWLNKIYNYTMGLVGLMVAATTAKSLTGSMNRKMPAGKVINETSTMLAAICGFMILAVTQAKNGSFAADYMGTKGILSSFISAFLTVNVYKFCIKRDITIKMPKEVPGAISQNFRDVFAFSFAVLGCAAIDLIARSAVGVPFADVFAKLLSPLFKGAESYPGLALIWFLEPLFWFVGVHGPSVVKPGLASALFGNTTINLEMFQNGQHPIHALTENFGNFVGELGGTGATFVVPLIFIFLMHSKQLKAVGKASVIPVMFAVNEPLLFAAPIILNPYFLVPFVITPVVNVIVGKLFITVLGMNGFMYVLPWATPGPIGIILNTQFQAISFALVAVLLVLDVMIYLPFCRAYDKVLLEQEAQNLAVETGEMSLETEEQSTTDSKENTQVIERLNQESSDLVVLNKSVKVLVLCAGAGTSAQLANALTEGAEKYALPIVANAGAYGSHYDILPNYDVVVLAPQVRTYYPDMKADTDKLGIKLIATRGEEYIELTRDSKRAINFILAQLGNKLIE